MGPEIVDDGGQAPPTFIIHVDGCPDFPCQEDQPVLVAMALTVRRGLLRGRVMGVAAGCRNGKCGICRVTVLEGRFRTLAMSPDLVTPEEAEAGAALACRLLPSSDLRLRPIPPPKRPVGGAG